ncbi:hypothetical protein [Novosphingobium sp. BL-8A]|uniref:hypothetical protein n=1 Tax=Novosphingobium sp. BL-8A TaxID=3127639 RepID=UPI0037579E03
MHLKNDVRSGAKAMGALTAMQFDLLGAVGLPFSLPIKLHRPTPTALAERRAYLIGGSFAMHFGIIMATAGQDTTVT